jgi:hypothetical protein
MRAFPPRVAWPENSGNYVDAGKRSPRAVGEDRTRLAKPFDIKQLAGGRRAMPSSTSVTDAALQ